ncbi:MAG: DNA repair protein RecN [Lachnospiraceae bacterium]|nr:DNA repair protein RecN [Lachnospiraceae bacterium]
MLLNLHVKNLALLQDVEMVFSEGFNVLSGETGAGKSLIIDSVNFALGDRVARDMVREDTDYALCELTFLVRDEAVREKLSALGIETEEDLVVLSRKIMNRRGTARINGETVSAATLKAAASLLIDIHGQHEHQSLLYKSRHLEMLDEYCGDELAVLTGELREVWQSYAEKQKTLAESREKLGDIEREKELLRFEVNEITAASLKEGEDEELENRYRKMQNARRILEAVGLAHRQCGYEEEASAGTLVGRALMEVRHVESLDEELASVSGLLNDIDGLLNDFNRAVAEYEQSLEYSGEEYEETENRLNQLNHLKSRYGNTISDVIKTLATKNETLARYENYEEYLEGLQKGCNALYEKALSLGRSVSLIRKKGASALAQQIVSGLKDLNFLDARFEIAVRTDEAQLSAKGMDDVEFMISTNPGEKIRPLTEVASGGELSRIMLALKTVLADKDNIETLIFDEIDTGISGRTAQKVSEKLMLLSRGRQVICITHLPQIAAMADAHYEILKQVAKGRTETVVNRLSGEDIVKELARMLSGAEVTEQVVRSAGEMKELAEELKRGIKIKE